VHTVIVIAIGLAVLAAGLFVGHTLGGAAGMARATLYFLPLWLIGAGTAAATAYLTCSVMARKDKGEKQWFWECRPPLSRCFTCSSVSSASFPVSWSPWGCAAVRGYRAGPLSSSSPPF
jgi:hypothetical protein